MSSSPRRRVPRLKFHGPPETGDNISQPEVPLTANLTRPQACALGRPDFLTTTRVASLSLLRGRHMDTNAHSISVSLTFPRVRDSLFAYIFVLPRTIDQRQSESRNYKPDYMSFNSGKSCLYRFGSSVMRRSACAKACDPMMKSASKRLGPCCAVLRRRFAYRANRRPASSHTRC